MPYRCVTCAISHCSGECPNKVFQGKTPVAALKCANCGGHHTANFPGCKVRLDLIESIKKARAKLDSNKTKKGVTNVTDTASRWTSTPVTPDFSYAAATKSITNHKKKFCIQTHQQRQKQPLKHRSHRTQRPQNSKKNFAENFTRKPLTAAQAFNQKKAKEAPKDLSNGINVVNSECKSIYGFDVFQLMEHCQRFSGELLEAPPQTRPVMLAKFAFKLLSISVWSGQQKIQNGGCIIGCFQRNSDWDRKIPGKKLPKECALCST